jgi:ABC-type multidrug transport system permease subunit
MLDGLILGILTWLSFLFSFLHFPTLIKRIMLKYFLLTDLISVMLTFFLLSGISHSITSVIGSITCGLLVNLSLMLNQTLGENNERPPVQAK